MGLEAKIYEIDCDEPGCIGYSDGSLDSLNRSGWRQKVIRDGKPVIEELATHAVPSSYMCRTCVLNAQNEAKRK